VRVVVTDDGSPTGTDDEEVAITVNEVNLPPVLDPVGDTSGDELKAITFTAKATDPDEPANTLSFSLGTPASCLPPKKALPAAASITSGGAFSWTPTEEEGPGTYCARIVVSDTYAGTGGALTDYEDIEITVNEVNAAPVLTVPSNFSTQWGVTLESLTASATDADIPANTLKFEKTSGPDWVSVGLDGTISFASIPPSPLGPNVVTIRVTDDGVPPKFDEKSFTITVLARPTTLEYDGRTAGEYSDKSTLSATLKDVGSGSPVGGTAIVGETVAFTFNGVSVGAGTTDTNGKASVLYQVTQASPGPYTVSSNYTGAHGYASSESVPAGFSVSKESAEFVSVDFLGSVPVSYPTFLVTGGVKELLTGGHEPNQNDGEMPGDITKVTSITAKLTGISSTGNYTGECELGSATGTGYRTIPFTCTFTGPFTVDAYTLTISITTGNMYYQAADYEDALSVWDPNAGFATGGGTFFFGGDRVSFGFSYTLTKGKTAPRSGFVVIRHLAGGGVCRVKSNNQMNAPAVNGNTATLSGKGNYVCIDAAGATTASAGNISIAAYAEDNATSGIGYDKFWVTNAAGSMLQMPGPAGANAAVLTGGNVQVPQPQGSKK
jgi:hypothetical protein